MADNKQNDLSKTKPYSTKNDNASNKTQTYQDDPSKTKTYQEEVQLADQTVGYESEKEELTDKTVAHNLGVGDAIELKDKDYKITGIISGDDRTGEAVIYKIMDNQGKAFALKLYYKFTNPKDEPNPEALTRIKRINDPDILNLVDFGTGANKYQGKFCYEISDFAEGANLISVPDIREKYTTGFLRSNVIPEIFKGIKTLHDYKIYHCDLKPENIVYLNKDQTDLVIGDYGSAKTFEETSEKQLTHTSTTKGTIFYLAPEQPRGVVSEKNDYYSFGMILLHLLYPELVNRKRLHKIVERQFSRKPIIDFKPEHEEINYLIAGLTLNDIGSRWGEEEVKAWLRGEEVEVRYTSEAEVRVQPINLGKTVIRTKEDIINYIENDSGWYENLIEDNEGYTLLLRWVSDLQGLELKKVFDKMVRSYQQDGKDYVHHAILRYFNPDRPVQVDMKAYDFWKAENVGELTASFVKHIDDIWKITELKKIKFYMFQLEFVLRQITKISENEHKKVFIHGIIDKITSELLLSPKSGFHDYICILYSKINDENLISLFYAVDKGRTFKDLENRSYGTINDVALLFVQDENLFSDKYIKVEKTFFYEKKGLHKLCDLSYGNLLFEIFKEKIKPEIKFTSLSIIGGGKYKLEYTFHKSLTEYFSNIGINKELSYGANQTFTYNFSKNHLTSINKIFKDFLLHLEKKGNIKQSLLSKKIIKQFYTSFKKEIKRKTPQFRIEQFINFLFKTRAIFLPAILGLFVFIYFATDWKEIAEKCAEIILLDKPDAMKIGDFLMGKDNDKLSVISILRAFIMFIPSIVVFLVLAVLWLIWTFISYLIGYCFPLIAGLAAYGCGILLITAINKNKTIFIENYKSVKICIAVVFLLVGSICAFYFLKLSI